MSSVTATVAAALDVRPMLSMYAALGAPGWRSACSGGSGDDALDDADEDDACVRGFVGRTRDVPFECLTSPSAPTKSTISRERDKQTSSHASHVLRSSC